MNTFPIMLNLLGRLAAVVGAGSVGLRKVEALRQAGAAVRLIDPNISSDYSAAGVELRREKYRPGLLEGCMLVFAATDDAELNARISADARAIGALVNAADQPQDCDFYLPSVARAGEVVLAVGTGGSAPGLAGQLRRQLESHLPPQIGEFAEAIGSLRASLREIPDAQARRQIFETLASQQSYNDFIQHGPAALQDTMNSLMARLEGPEQA